MTDESKIGKALEQVQMAMKAQEEECGFIEIDIEFLETIEKVLLLFSGTSDNQISLRLIEKGIDELVKVAHRNSSNAGWWNCPITGEDLLSNPTYAPYVLAAKQMLTVSEVSEAMEGIRTDAMDDKMPHRSMEECEFADVLIRAGDYAGKREMKLGKTVVEKIAVNLSRPDHQISNRRKLGGKKF